MNKADIERVIHCFAELTEEIKKEVSIPVILTGGVTEGEDAEKLLEQGKAKLLKKSLILQLAIKR